MLFIVISEHHSVEVHDQANGGKALTLMNYGVQSPMSLNAEQAKAIGQALMPHPAEEDRA